MTILHLQQLRTHHLPPIDLTIEQAQCVCITAPSGTGKSLLLRAIADLDPHEGQVLLDGQPCEAFDPQAWRHQVGLLPAESQWWFERMADHFAGNANELLARLGFEPAVLQREVNKCSTGERQRLSLIRLLLNEPKVLLLDEPTASLDSASARKVEALIQDYRTQHQAIVLWVTHDHEQAQRVADRIYTLTADGLQEVTA